MKDTNIRLGCGTIAVLLTLIFVAGKVFNYIDWSWWIVLSPLITSLLCGAGIMGVVVLSGIVLMVVGKK